MKTPLLIFSLLVFMGLSLPNSFAQDGLHSLEENPPQSNQQLLDPMHAYSLFGTVNDQYGRAVPRALIQVSGKSNHLYRTDEKGRFQIPNVHPDDYLSIGKNGCLNNSRPVKAFTYFLNQEGQILLQITLPVLDIHFVVGPEGGNFNGDIQIDIPPGAVTRPTEISACILPPGFLIQGKDEMRSLRMGSVHFEPAGLAFKKPIQLSLVATQALATGADPVVLHSSTKNGAKVVEEIDGTDLQINGNKWTFKMTHFSDCELVDKNTLIRKIPSKKPPGDTNLDGSEDDQDADRIVHLIGGPQQMELSTTIISTQTVVQRESNSIADQKSDTHAQGAGMKVKGVGASIDEAKSSSLTKTEAEAYGIEIIEEKSFTNKVQVQVDEYNDRCKMLFTLYDIDQVMKYIKVYPSKKELDNLKKQIGNDPPDEEGWHFRKTMGASSVQLGRTLHEGMRLAVKVAADGTLDVYALAENLTVRRLKGLKSVNCQEVKKTKTRSVRYHYYPPPTGKGVELYSITYLGLKRGAKADKIYRGIECGTAVSEEWSESRANMEFHEIDASNIQENTTTTEVKAGLELDYKGIIQVEGHASHKTEKSRQVSNSLHHAVQQSVSEQSTYALTIFDTHEDHESDHDLYPLYHVYELRDWHYEFSNSDKLPPSLKKKMRKAKGQGDGKIQGKTKDGRRILLVQENDKEYWYVSSPPRIIFRDAGKQLVRIAERPCNEEPPIQEPELPQQEDRSTHSSPKPKEADQSSSSLPGEESNQQWFMLGLGASLALPPVQTHAPLNAEEQLLEAIYADPFLIEALSETLGGEFFLGTFDAPPLIGKGDVGLEVGYLISGGLKLGKYWQFSVLFGQSSNRGTSVFPVTVINTLDGNTNTIEGIISTKLQTQRLAISMTRSFGTGKYRPILGFGALRSTYSIGASQAEIAGLVFPLWAERSANNWGGMAQGGVEIVLSNDIGFSVRLQGASEVKANEDGGFSNIFVPGVLFISNWSF